MTTMRRPEKFVALDASLTYTFPLKKLEWEAAQSVVGSYSAGIGRNFSFNHRGNAPAFLEDGMETIRLLSVQSTTALAEADMDDLRAKLWRIGTGYLYLLNGDGTRRWSKARIEEIPRVSVTGDNAQFAYFPANISFRRLSFWQGETADTGSRTITTSGGFTITALGNVPVQGAAAALVFRLRSNAAGASGGFGTTVVITNSTTGETLTIVASSGGVNGEIKIDCGANRIYRSDDDGATYTSLWASTTPGNQRGLMTLAPGANSFTVTGVTNADLSWSYQPTYL